MKRNEEWFRSVLSQMRQLAKNDGTFDDFQVKNPVDPNNSWTCRFDDANLFDKTGLTTGKTLFFLTVCNN
jgi:hypothetical protein